MTEIIAPRFEGERTREIQRLLCVALDLRLDQVTSISAETDSDHPDEVAVRWEGRAKIPLEVFAQIIQATAPRAPSSGTRSSTS